MEPQILQICDIVLDDNIYSRHSLDESHIVELYDDLKLNAQFPPIEVFLDEIGNYYLVDGLHRLKAYIKSNRDKIEAFIYNGSHRDALLYSVGVNASHGKRRTNKDKIKSVTKLLKDKEWLQWSDGKIAAMCSVSQPFVSKLRRELTQNGFELPYEVLDINGRKLKTNNIGKTSVDNNISNARPTNKKKVPNDNDNDSTPISEDDAEDEEIFSDSPQDILNQLTSALTNLKLNLDGLLEGYPDTFDIPQSFAKKLLKSKQIYDNAWISFIQSYNLDD
jgi:hypothetical protein